jgi:hypothetical protein
MIAPPPLSSSPVDGILLAFDNTREKVTNTNFHSANVFLLQLVQQSPDALVWIDNDPRWMGMTPIFHF